MFISKLKEFQLFPGMFILGWFLFSCGGKVEIPESVKAFEEKLPETIDYNLHVKPILSDRCFACHGPDKNKIEAGLQLANPEGATKKLESGFHAIVAGNVSKSELVRRILSSDPEEVMPVPSSNLTLSDEEKAILIKWIDQGAKYKEHWSLSPILEPEVPSVGRDFLARWGWKEDEETRWVKNEIDQFSLSKMKELGLKPSPEAEKHTLLRRVSMDLTGLPPSPEEVLAFEIDKSPDAYEKAVDRLLASPHYGEQQAVSWLDLARYADSHGYQDDGLRNASPYRDWVISAYNTNMSLDKFVMYQLAGDLMPKPGRDMLVATGFNRMHPQTQEGGVVPEEYRTEYVADRTNTFGKAFLGLTMECARCHDHKYDPILAKDYYSLSAFFNQNNDVGLVPYSGEASPTVLLPTPEEEKELHHLKGKIASLAQKMQPNHFNESFEKWKNSPGPKFNPEKTRLVYLPFEEANEFGYLTKNSGKFMSYHGGDPDRKPKQVPGIKGKGISLPGDGGVLLFNDTVDRTTLSEKDLKEWKKIPKDKRKNKEPVERYGKALNFEQSQDFSISLWVRPVKDSIEGVIFQRSNYDFEGYRGYSVYLHRDRTMTILLSHVWPANCIEFRTRQKLRLNQWQNVCLTYDGSGKAKGVKLFIDGKEPAQTLITDNLEKSILHAANHNNWGGLKFFSMGLDDRRKTISDIEIDELQIFGRQLSALEVRSVYSGRDEIFQALSSNQETSLLMEYYLLAVDPRFSALKKEKNALRFTLVQKTSDVAEAMIMNDLKSPFQRKTYILKRGAYDAFGQEVNAETPEFLGKLPDGYPKNRLGLAKWLLDEKNPLFSRVMANRIWLQFFGNGIVKTQEDFGNQGSLPSHPELLDWLAFHYRKDGWDTKKFIRRIVLSATYRQSSKASKQDLEKDPENQWLARGPAYRYSAEQVRDNALAASGLLVRKIGGKSVYPYQPAGIWEALATRNVTKYRQQHADSLYRRSMYTIWKRSSPPPMMLNFDAPDRSLCAVRRQKTATPLQALVTLNDPQFVEAARVLAQKTGLKHPSLDDRIRWIFLSCISRPPRPKELSLMKELYEIERQGFSRDPKRAIRLLKTGEYPTDTLQNLAETAGLTLVANTLLNYDEAQIKR